MDQMDLGTIVLSRAGRDSGRLFAVVAKPEENFRLIADGRLRRVERPKRKKLRHLLRAGESAVIKSLAVSGGLTNSLLRKELALFEKSKES
ncbi:MAG: KOW domain-containing RNA-binding protein [Clostridia bacterium]|nr:KOW domain-containing RNA-binding protein [Clostridia bacterium]